MSRCPDDDELKRYLNSELAEALATQISAHLESCAVCVAKLDQLTARPSLVMPVDATNAYRPAAHARSESAGTILGGRYKLVECIGTGGMGSVWSAQQSEPVKRKVAVKLIKHGMESDQVLVRFEAERQALAMMDHPNIAKVHDGGLHEGRPYFVMELVKGVPITEYCDSQRLTLQQRLELFVPVCQAIQHAHQKGIIHRDIKPSNVLIALYDERPVPKVIDFGVAKATVGTLTEATLDTGFGAIVGTPQYMSPEQATFNNLDIDTRTDVYSLGVLLYELLSGSPPFSKQELEKKGLMEVLRVVREVDPPKPSTKLSTADALPSLSASRGTEPKKLTGLLRNELDWIVMKALEKDRGRRYETANNFAADVSRYLSGEPVLAHPPSAGYRLRKFIRRHKGPVLAASLVLVALLAGICGTTYGMVRADQAAGEERKAKQQAENDRDAKEEARKNEEQQKKYAQAIAEFVKNDFLALTSVEGQDLYGGDSKNKLTRNTTLGQLLDRAAAKLRERHDLDPHTAAELNFIVGYSYRNAGDGQKAIEFLERAVQLRSEVLGPNHVDTLVAMSYLGSAFDAAGLLDQAVQQHLKTLNRQKAALGPDDRHTLGSVSNLAGAYQAAGKPQLALPLFEEAYERTKATLGPDHALTLSSMNNIALAYRQAGKIELSLSMYEQAYKLAKSKFGENNHDTLTYMNNLALAYREDGTTALAISLFKDALALKTAKYGIDHPTTLNTMENLAGAYMYDNQLKLALPLFEEAYKLRKAKLGVDHPATLTVMNNLALTYERSNRLDLSLPLYEETVKYKTLKLGREHPDTLISMDALAKGYWKKKEFAKAIVLFEEILRIKEARFGRDHADTLNTAANLAVNYRDAGRMADALPLFEETHRAARKFPELQWISTHLLDAYATAGAEDKFAALFEELMLDARRTLPKDSLQLAAPLANFGNIHLELQKWPAAEALLRESLTIREQKEPDAWATSTIRALLAAALMGQKKYAEAEPLLLSGVAGMKRVEQSMPPHMRRRLPEGIERLVQLYEALDKKDEAAKWRKELEAIQAPKKPDGNP